MKRISRTLSAILVLLLPTILLFSQSSITDNPHKIVTPFSIVSSKGARTDFVLLSELVTLVSGHASDATTIQIPANSIVLGVDVRVTVAPATTATFTVTGTSTATAFQTGGSVSTVLSTTDVGTKACPYLNTTAQTITLTYNAQPTDSLGRVRVTIHYLSITAATS